MLSGELAVIGCPHTESLTGSDGQVRKSSGYLTGLVERPAGRWRLRHAHWSTHPAGG